MGVPIWRTIGEFWNLKLAANSYCTFGMVSSILKVANYEIFGSNWIEAITCELGIFEHTD